MTDIRYSLSPGPLFCREKTLHHLFHSNNFSSQISQGQLTEQETFNPGPGLKPGGGILRGKKDRDDRRKS